MKFRSLMNKYAQIISYGIIGTATMIINIATYQILILLSIDYKIGNLIAIILTKIVAYILNKEYVFHTKCENISELIKEMTRYIFARGITGVIDYLGVIVLVEFFHFDKVYVKYFIQLIVVILNYVLGKNIVFVSARKSKKE